MRRVCLAVRRVCLAVRRVCLAVHRAGGSERCSSQERGPRFWKHDRVGEILRKSRRGYCNRETGR